MHGSVPGYSSSFMACANEATSLLTQRKTCFKKLSRVPLMIKKRYWIHVYPWGGYIVLFYCGLVITLLFGGNELDPGILKIFPIQVNHQVYYTSPFYLLFPVFGIIGEMFHRGKVMIVAVVSAVFGKAIFLISNFVPIPFKHESNKLFLSLPAYTLLFFGFGLFLTNFIQLGLDQLLFEPSDRLRSYVYWLVGLVSVLQALIFSSLVVLAMLANYNVLYWYTIGIATTLLVLLIIVLFTICCCKRHINIEPPPQLNPVKHIYKVIRYAWFHKYPVRRSAYTYTEMPSRLDLCKKRYGGPFTTDEVETVKSFGHILLILVSMFGIYCTDTTITIANKIYDTSNVSYTNASFTEIITVLYPSTITYGSSCFCMLIMQLLCVPFLSQYLPRLLVRMGMGLFLALCTSCCLTVLSMWLNTYTCSGLHFVISYGLLAVPQLLYGCAHFLAFTTTIEFIIAQSPLRMQGLLIGLWLSLFFASNLLNLSSQFVKTTADIWQYFMVKAVLVFVSCLCFLVVAGRYKYRERNEVTDVNERLIIVEYTERQLHVASYDNQLTASVDSRIKSMLQD